MKEKVSATILRFRRSVLHLSPGRRMFQHHIATDKESGVFFLDGIRRYSKHGLTNKVTSFGKATGL